MQDRYTGKVKFFNQEKGYGFIMPDDRTINNGADVFVHVRDLEESNLSMLEEDLKVSFELGEHRGKTKASNIQIEG